jgi:hypothetical protein
VFFGIHYLQDQIRKDIVGLVARKRDIIYTYGLAVGKSEGKRLFRMPLE